MIMFASYDHLPAPLQSALSEIRQFVEEVDGQTLGTPTLDGCFIDNGTICADTIVDAFNTIVAALTRSP